AEAEDATDIRVVESHGEPGLASQPLHGAPVGGELGGEHLDRHVVPARHLTGEVDERHAPFAQLFLDLVTRVEHLSQEGGGAIEIGRLSGSSPGSAKSWCITRRRSRSAKMTEPWSAVSGMTTTNSSPP